MRKAFVLRSPPGVGAPLASESSAAWEEAARGAGRLHDLAVRGSALQVHAVACACGGGGDSDGETLAHNGILEEVVSMDRSSRPASGDVAVLECDVAPVHGWGGM